MEDELRLSCRVGWLVGSCSDCALLSGYAPDSALTCLSLRRKKVSKERATPLSASLRLRFGQPALLTKRGRYANSAAPQTRVSLIPVLLRCSAHTEGEVRIAKSNSRTSKPHKYAPWRHTFCVERFHFDDCVCQNIDIGLIDREISTSKATSHFQENLMAKLWSNAQLIEHFLLLWKLR
jgi:hypothetical protein